LLRPGDTAPPFTLLDSAGRERSLASLLSAKGLVLFFYPGDFTPICTREVCMVQELHAGLEAAGLPVAGISPDDPATHERFRARYSLEYTLLSDPEKSAIRSYGVDGPLGLGVRRATFRIGADGKIEDVLRADIRVQAHRRFLTGAISRAQ
jgi:peroxiredoxin Q/BCP